MRHIYLKERLFALKRRKKKAGVHQDGAVQEERGPRIEHSTTAAFLYL